MRILGFSELWPKLKQPTFTTFRFPRRDADWQVGETVKIVYQPRRKGGGDVLGIAEIMKKEARDAYGNKPSCDWLCQEEAQADGFFGLVDMLSWLMDTYGQRRIKEDVLNKLTLRWEKRE